MGWCIEMSARGGYLPGSRAREGRTSREGDVQGGGGAAGHHPGGGRHAGGGGGVQVQVSREESE